MRKRGMAGFLAGVMLFSLVACGSKESGTPDAAVLTPEATQAADGGAEPSLTDKEAGQTQTGQEPGADQEVGQTQTDQNPEAENKPDGEAQSAQTGQNPDGQTKQTEAEPTPRKRRQSSPYLQTTA